MGKRKNGPVLFDDDFEVTYEDDTIDIINLNDDFDDDFDDNFEDEIDIDYERPSQRKKRKSERISNARPVKNISNKTDKIPSLKRAMKKDVPKAYGNRHIFDTSYYVIRTASIILSVSIIVILILEFFRGAALYGSFSDLLSGDKDDMFMYVMVSLFIIIVFSISILVSLKRDRIKQNGRTYKLDMGRGASNFIALYVLSYLSFIACAIIPESFDNHGYVFIDGIIGSLNVFGSMHNLLLGLCFAGAVSCIARKKMN